MLTIKRTKDPELIKHFYLHPEMWKVHRDDSQQSTPPTDLSPEVYQKIDNDNNYFIIIYDDKTPCGMVIFYPADDDHPEVLICHFYVLPEFKHNALTIALEAKRWFFSTLQYDELYTYVPSTRPKLVKFTEKVGFRIINRVPHRETIDGKSVDMIIMETNN